MSPMEPKSLEEVAQMRVRMRSRQIRGRFKAFQGHDAASLRDVGSRSPQVQIPGTEKGSRPQPVLLRKSAEPLGSTQILTLPSCIRQ